MKPALLAILIFCSASLYAQTTETPVVLPLNSKWEICDKPIVSYIRTGTLVLGDSAYFTGPVKDYYKSGILQMKGEYNKRGLLNGSFTFYHPNGKIEREGNFVEDQMVGTWSYYDTSGRLILQMECENNKLFTPYFALSSNGDTILKNGSGSFVLELKTYPGVFTTPQALSVRSVEGKSSKGVRDGNWTYYVQEPYFSGQNPAPPVKKLLFEETYSKGEYVSSKWPGQSRSKEQPVVLSLQHSKEYKLRKLTTDHAFGADFTGKKLTDFMFENISPVIIAYPNSYSNNMATYVKCVNAALRISKYNINGSPALADFDGNTASLVHEIRLLGEKELPLPDINTLISFVVRNDGTVGDFQMKGNLDNETVDLFRYYFSAVRNLKRCPDASGCKVELLLEITNKVGIADGVRGVLVNGDLKYPDAKPEIKSYALRNNAFIGKTEAHFPGGDVAWENYLRYNREKIQTINYREDAHWEPVELMFTVDVDGSITDVKALNAKAVYPPILEKTILMFKKSPKWVPGELDGVKFKTTFRTTLIWSR